MLVPTNQKLLGRIKLKEFWATLLLSSICVECVYADPPRVVADPAFNTLAVAPESGEGKWTGSFGLGLTLRRGGTNSTQGSLTANATRAMRDSRLVARSIVVRSTSDSGEKSDNANIEFRAERNFATDFFGFLGAGLERDTDENLDLRQIYSFGAGARWIRTDELQLNLYSGLGYSVERNRHGSKAKGFEVLLGSELNYSISPTSKLSQRAVFYPDSIGGAGPRYAIQADITTRINQHFGLQIAVLHKFRSGNGAAEDHTDSTLFTGITSNF